MPGSTPPPVITLLGLEAASLMTGAAVVERDITRSEADLRAYGEMIPVTLINGVQHDFWHVSEQRLRAALAAAGATGQA